MANLKELRRRIKSIKSTSQITKAMQMVAAAKMKKAQDLAQKGQPYLAQLQKVLMSLGGQVDEKLNPLLQKGKGEKIGVILLTTDKGLCGSINTNVLKFVSDNYDKKNTIFYTVGKKGRLYLAKTGRDLKADFLNPEAPAITDANDILNLVTEDFLEGKIGKVEVVYPHFVNTAVQTAASFSLLPIENLPDEKSKSTDETEFEFEPNANDVLAGILPHYVSYSIYQLLLESKASEHSSRMVAMKNATDNAGDLVDNLTLEYNKARQAMITNQILEISSAMAAMEN